MKSTHSIRHLARTLLAFAVCIGSPAHSVAQLSATGESAVPTGTTDVETEPEPQAPPASFEPYLDGVMNALFEDYDLVGAVFSLVYDGQPAFSKGYGYADLESRTPADPAVHLFRPGSVSKLVTWTAVMQLFEQGKVRLDAPVSEYIDQFPIPGGYGAVTLEHALTHTPGLEDGGMGYLFAESADDLVPLAESLATHAPTQQWSPGTTAAYSNWTTALAGLVVANVSGMTFEEYVARNIFEPLGMRHSSFDEPLPAPLDANMATGYSDVGKGLELLGYEYIRNFGPAGALAATADDMARFIVAHVNGGELNGARILNPETARLMHSRLFGPVEGLPGMAHGFMELWHNGHRFVGHGGDTIAFHSDLAIDPDRGFGFYVSFNAPDGGQARDVVTRAVLNYFYPEAAPAEPAPPPEGTAERVANIVGAYRANRRSHTKLEAVAGLAADIPIVPGNDGRIVLALPMFGGEYEEVEPYVFREVNGRSMLAFETDASGAVVRALPSMPIIAFDKLAFHETAGNHQLVIALALLAALFVIINAVRNRSAIRASGGTGARATWTLLGLSIVNLAFVLGLVALFATAVQDPVSAMFNFPPTGTGALLILPIAGALLTLATLGFGALLWARGIWNLAKRLRYTYVTAINVLFVLVLNYWNMIGWNYY